MKIFKSNETPIFSRPTLTVGTFDGIHHGHKRVIQRVIETANNIEGNSVVLTFWPHPRHVLGNADFSLLNTLDEKLQLLEASGIDAVILYEFTREFASITSYDFVKDILVGNYRVKNLVVGHDHHFGKMREGKYETLGNLSKEFDFKLFKVNTESYGTSVVSSSNIRNVLIEGNVKSASELLGYHYMINGKVIDGFKLGKNIGYPTANIEIDSSYKQIPGNGVYAVLVTLMGKKYKGMMNIGYRPTINLPKPELSLEVHLFDFSETIYGQTIKVEFIERLRSEVKFADITELKSQLEIDNKNANIALSRIVI